MVAITSSTEGFPICCASDGYTIATRGHTNRVTDMSMTRRVLLVALGAILITAFVVVWKYVTGIMALFVENFWCTTFEKADVCRFRGYQHFLIWTVIGIINALILGLLFDRIAGRSRG